MLPPSAPENTYLSVAYVGVTKPSSGGAGVITLFAARQKHAFISVVSDLYVIMFIYLASSSAAPSCVILINVDAVCQVDGLVYMWLPLDDVPVPSRS